MWKIAELVMLVFLGIGAVWDIRTKQVPAGYLLAGTVGSVMYQAFTGNQLWYLWVLGIATGGVFLILSKCTGEGIGYGDSWMILNLGIFLGVWKLLCVLGMAFLCSSVAAGAGLMAKKWNRKTRVPFFPFLTIGYMGAMLW